MLTSVSRRLLTLALVVYLAVVAWGTLGPDPGSEVNAVGRQVKSVEVVVRGESSPAPSTPAARAAKASPRFGRLSSEDLGNILLFVPFGVLVPLRFRWLRWWTVPLGCALSGAIELTQLLVLTHRSAQWRDWQWNTVGAAVGFALFLLGSLAWSRAAVKAA
jgi:glycopeptide antibiotics resistance protein